MKISLSSLREYIDLPEKPEEIAGLLTGAGIEVEGIDPLSEQDVAFELSLTPNLGHAMSVRGIARVLAAQRMRPCKKQPWEESTIQAGRAPYSVHIEAADLCPRYSALCMKGVRVGPSPSWLAAKLEAAQIRPVNNIVDITNLVAHELGQPLHAFDFDALEGPIGVRRARPVEEMAFLDGKRRILPEGALVIHDGKKPVALAGIMGDMASSVSDTTTATLIEAAFFQPQAIRRACRALGIISDSAKRFERGTDPHMTLPALTMAASLIQRICPTATAEWVVDYLQSPLSSSFAPKEIACRVSRTRQVLGYPVTLSELESVFARLGFETKVETPDCVHVMVPVYRHDITEEIDLIEEVSILHGIKQPQVALPYIASELPHRGLFSFERNVRQRLIAEGLQECVTCSLISPKMVEIVRNHPISAESLVKVMNPMSEEQSILRPSLLPGLLDVALRNCNRKVPDIQIFEIGCVHFKKHDKISERTVVGIMLGGAESPAHFTREASCVDFFDIKGIVEDLCRALRIEEPLTAASHCAIFHTGRQAHVMVSGLQIGTVGELHPTIIKALDIPERLFFAELDLTDLCSVLPESVKMKALVELPASTRDWTITLPQSIRYHNILEAIKALHCPILEQVSLITIFTHEKLGADKHNITLRFQFRDAAKTIVQEEVDREFTKITKCTEESLTKYLK